MKNQHFIKLTAAVITAALTLTACASGSSSSQSVKERIDAKLGNYNSAIQTIDVRYVTEKQIFKYGKMHSQIQIHAKNGNVYETLIEKSLMPEQKLRQIKRLKQVTLRAISAIEGKPNHYFFYTWENMKY